MKSPKEWYDELLKDIIPPEKLIKMIQQDVFDETYEKAYAQGFEHGSLAGLRNVEDMLHRKIDEIEDKNRL